MRARTKIPRLVGMTVKISHWMLYCYSLDCVEEAFA